MASLDLSLFEPYFHDGSGVCEGSEEKTEIESITVKVGLKYPWAFYGSQTKTVRLINAGGAWWTSLDCQAESILINTRISDLLISGYYCSGNRY